MAIEELVLPPPRELVAAPELLQCSPVADAAGAAVASLPPGAALSLYLDRLDPLTRDITHGWDARRHAHTVLSNARHAEYDAYFSVARSTEPSAVTVYCEAAVVALQRLLVESAAGHSLSPIEFAQLCGTLEGIIFRHASATAAARAQTTPSGGPVPAPDRSLPPDALRRWRRGHHICFVLLQALLIAHARLGHALRHDDEDLARRMLEWSTELWWAAGAAFRFAGDFDAQAYARIVRPTMCAPFVTDGFSGLFSADHAELIGMLRTLRPSLECFQSAASSLRAQHRQYLWALATVYESHAWVCESFVGNGRSLRGAVCDQSLSAITVLRGRFKVRAMASAGAPTPSQEAPMIVVLEVWHLRPGLEGDALAIMQKMDELLGPNAHAFEGDAGHAQFYQREGNPSTVHMIYRWRDRASHEELLRSERDMVESFSRQYCARDREIHYLRELPVDVHVASSYGAGVPAV